MEVTLLSARCGHGRDRTGTRLGVGRTNKIFYKARAGTEMQKGAGGGGALKVAALQERVVGWSEWHWVGGGGWLDADSSAPPTLCSALTP
jgi:hypothetical protein